MDYRFRIYYITKDYTIISKIKEKFNIKGVSVNGESLVETDDFGKTLLFETEKRGFIRIREYGETNR